MSHALTDKERAHRIWDAVRARIKADYGAELPAFDTFTRYDASKWLVDIMGIKALPHPPVRYVPSMIWRVLHEQTELPL